jgi:hypothetical protein
MRFLIQELVDCGRWRIKIRINVFIIAVATVLLLED